MSSRSVVALRHVSFEDLGSFAPVLAHRGYDLTYREAGIESLSDVDPLAPDLLVVLGGPIGAYEDHEYPFLLDELRLLEKRLVHRRPTLGICLGSQLIARALGARVYPMGCKEIGFAPLTLTPDAGESCLGAFAEDGIVLHWHGDTFDLPAGAVRLAGTELCANQAFAFGKMALGLQFHAEILLSGFERWLIGHAHELAAAGLKPSQLRAQAVQHGPSLAARGEKLMERWLSEIDAR